ncbi:hypothetical protein [Kouleothrix sp.]|uniref:hypothetical protein n=1 Tax=Kouleothrix sp. TaxID=2779161 RepID=UPI00391B0946
MIGTQPASTLPPLDYRYALDAALATVGAAPLAICRADELRDAVEQRVARGEAGPGGLWIEPDARGWHEDLAAFARALAPGAPLAIVMSLPLARLLPERRGWGGAPLGLRGAGAGQLIDALAPAGFTLRARHGVHSLASIVLQALSRRAGQPDLADRLYFAARLRYRAEGRSAGLAAVALLIADKNG